MMGNDNPLIFIHGLEGSSQGVKATLLRDLFVDIVIPDFRGSLHERMDSLEEILANKNGWIIIGSSFGGLMGALYTCQHPHKVEKLILLAPALIWPDFATNPPDPVSVPTTVYHGLNDDLIPVEEVQKLAEDTFTRLKFNTVDDDHGLYKTAHTIDWPALVSST
jgi:pimeloyl-ACP methyl ester carboxylesterase